MTQFNSRGTVLIKEDPELFDGVLVLRGSRNLLAEDGKYSEYGESRTKTRYIGQITQVHLEEFYQDLSTKWPEMEEFVAFLSPATLAEYVRCDGPRERIVLTPGSTETI